MIQDMQKRPQRWDEPFCTEMRTGHVEWILSSQHFQAMQKEAFPQSLPLADIVRNDCRIRRYEKNQLIINAGAYTNSAFLVLSGQVTLVLSPGIDPSAWGQQPKPKSSPVQDFLRWLQQPNFPEVRAKISAKPLVQGEHGSSSVTKASQSVHSAAVLIPDLAQRITAGNAEFVQLKAGDFFGESAVLGRTMMTNTAIANNTVEILEIRWQGLRDIGKYNAKFKAMIDRLYRERGLFDELLNQPLFKYLSKDKVAELAKIALFEVHGDFGWQTEFRKASAQARSEEDINLMIDSEPIIAAEGDYPDGLLLVRSGFARVSRRINHGHYTFGHLTRGDLFGLSELYSAWATCESKSLSCSLRSLGYADIIRIPSWWLEKNIFAAERSPQLSDQLQRSLADEQKQLGLLTDTNNIDRKLTEFLVEQRIINGTQTMMIDLERCVRCDDCVTACANAHDNNPRFTRHGPRHGQYMIANACMHCDDPVCMIGCPTGAIHRSVDGVVTINDETCVGCASCANSCPYDNIRMVITRNQDGNLYTDENSKPIVKATKCDLCSQSSAGPACERACAHDALTRIDVKDIKRLADWVGR